jgi:hypothetical protein
MTTKPETTEIDEAVEFEERARRAARAKFAEWGRLEKEQRPRRILWFSIAVVITTSLLILFLYYQSTAGTG